MTFRTAFCTHPRVRIYSTDVAIDPAQCQRLKLAGSTGNTRVSLPLVTRKTETGCRGRISITLIRCAVCETRRARGGSDDCSIRVYRTRKTGCVAAAAIGADRACITSTYAYANSVIGIITCITLTVSEVVSIERSVSSKLTL